MASFFLFRKSTVRSMVRGAMVAALSRSAKTDEAPSGDCAYTAVAAANARTAATHTRRHTRCSFKNVLDVCGI